MAELQNRFSKDKSGEEKLSSSQKSQIQQIDSKSHNKPANKTDAPLAMVRRWVGQQFLNFLESLKAKDIAKAQELEAELEHYYAAWADIFQVAHRSFSEIWDVLNLIEKESVGWFRVSPKANQSFLSITEFGYSFSAGIEQNHSKGAPMPSKFILISFGHSDHWSNGIGDERVLGRPEPIDDTLIGLKACKPKDKLKALENCKAMLAKAAQTDLVIQIYSKALGQRGVRVSLLDLKSNNLTQMLKGLFLGLNADNIKDLKSFFKPNTKIELLEHNGLK
jgi:hypothetical protein